MTDRENSSAFQMLPLRARRVFAAIERAIGDRSGSRMLRSIHLESSVRFAGIVPVERERGLP